MVCYKGWGVGKVTSEMYQLIWMYCRCIRIQMLAKTLKLPSLISHSQQLPCTINTIILKTRITKTTITTINNHCHKKKLRQQTTTTTTSITNQSPKISKNKHHNNNKHHQSLKITSKNKHHHNNNNLYFSNIFHHVWWDIQVEIHGKHDAVIVCYGVKTHVLSEGLVKRGVRHNNGVMSAGTQTLTDDHIRNNVIHKYMQNYNVRTYKLMHCKCCTNLCAVL